MSKKHAEGQYKADELKKWLNEERTAGQMYAELLTLVVANYDGGNKQFYENYKMWRNGLFDATVRNNVKANDFELTPAKQMERIMKLLPKRESLKATVLHSEMRNVNLASANAYNSYSSRSDVAEVYAAYLLYGYSEVKLFDKAVEYDNSLKKYHDIKEKILIQLENMIIQAAPYTGPKLVTFTVASKNDKYLDDDIENTRKEDIIARFRLACGRKDTRMTYKLLGELRQVEPEGIDYYEGYADYSDEQYEDAIHYLQKVEEKSFYYPQAVTLLMECYAMLGDEEGFLNVLRRCQSNQISFDYISYVTQLLIDNAEKCADDIYSQVSTLKYSKDPDNNFRGTVRRNAYQAMIDGTNLLQEFEAYKQLNENTLLSEAQIYQLEKCNKKIHFLFLGQDFFYVGKNKDAMTYENTIEEIEGGIMNLIRDKYMGQDNVAPTAPNITLEDQLFSFDAFYMLGLYEAFHLQVGYHLEWFKAMSFLDKVTVLLKKAYVEGMAMKNPNAELMEFVKTTYLDVDDENQDNLINAKMRAVLSNDCYVAFKAAEWQFMKSKEDDYGWKDAGMISLSYFRIVEMTINERIIRPLSILLEWHPRALLHSERENMSSREKNRYNEKWGKIVNTIYEVSKGSDKGMMLGDLEKMFTNIGSNYDSNDSIAVLIREKTESLLNDIGKEMIFNQLYLENALSGDNRTKYRNPPAHCKYLSYDVAVECRQYSCDLLYELNTFMK